MITVSQCLIVLLIIIAARVAIGLMYKCNMWRWIIAYWVVLTLKNLADFIRI